MTNEQSSGVTFEDISCLRPYADKINDYMSRRPARSVRVCLKRFMDFTQWAQEVERQAERDGNPRTVLKMPIDPSDLAAYVGWLSRRGLKVSSIRTYLGSIRMLHVAANLFNPIASDVVKDAIAEVADKHFDDDFLHARALSVAELDSILAALPARRITRGNNVESVEGARKRANVDRALLLTMIGAGMRSSEAAELTWHRVRRRQDGSGRVFMPVKGKASRGVWLLSDEEFLKALMVLLSEDEDWVFGIFHPSGEWLLVDEECFQALAAIKPEGANRDSRVFNLSGSQVNRRLKRMSEEAGIDSQSISGYTPRVTLYRLMIDRGTPMDKINFQLRLVTERIAYSPLPDNDVVPPWIQRLKGESEGMSLEMAKEILGKYIPKEPAEVAFKVRPFDPPGETRDKRTIQEPDEVDIKAPAIELNDDEGPDTSQPASQVAPWNFVYRTRVSDC